MGGYIRNVNYINTDLSKNDNYSGGGGFSLAHYVPEKYSIRLNTEFTYFDTRSSVNTMAQIHYWTQIHTVSLSLLFIKGFDISTTAGYNWQQATSAFANSTSALVWNANISRNFLDNKVILRLQVNNLLDQNTGISRGISDNVTTGSRTNILGRYWLLSLSYHFNKERKK